MIRLKPDVPKAPTKTSVASVAPKPHAVSARKPLADPPAQSAPTNQVRSDRRREQVRLNMIAYRIRKREEREADVAELKRLRELVKDK